MNKVILNASQEEEIQQLCNKFEEWRKEKKSIGKRIPEELWLEAIKLAEKYSVCQVSRRLRLGYMDLKKRMRDMNAGDREPISETRETGGFLELKVSSPPFTMGRGSMTPCIMEIMRSDGAQLRIYSTPGLTFDITRICESFVREEGLRNKESRK
jgi:hypothetical protein